MAVKKSPDWTRMPTPKRLKSHASGRHSWYSFYPGFSREFAFWAVEHLGANDGTLVLDPWNGSGTTTALAAEFGLGAIGNDLNPAMVVIAKAKVLDPLDVPSIRPLCRQILNLANEVRSRGAAEDEPLSYILAHEGPRSFRALERAIRILLVDEDDNFALDVNRVSPLAAFFYVALFRTCRALLRQAACSNPVWTKLNVPRQSLPRPNSAKISEQLCTEVESMLANETVGRPAARSGSPPIRIQLGYSHQLSVSAQSVNLTLSSPPYCTRVDYAVAMLPELSILGLKRGSTFDDLRRNLTGTTTVPKDCDPIEPRWGPTCVEFLDRVRDHPSRASSGYYLKSHARYFSQLSQSIGEIARVTATRGKAVLVVQDSYYKEIHNDLPQIVVEMACAHGFMHVTSRRFPTKRLIAATNPRVRRYRKAEVTATEAVVVLQA